LIVNVIVPVGTGVPPASGVTNAVQLVVSPAVTVPGEQLTATVAPDLGSGETVTSIDPRAPWRAESPA
jgi:hypothetical protein